MDHVPQDSRDQINTLAQKYGLKYGGTLPPELLAKPVEPTLSGDICPDCGMCLRHQGGCLLCPHCGYEKCG